MQGQRIAIMQPYFCPYIGYFQLINSVEQFVIYDNIEYTKKGWINRNRYLRDGADVVFTLPLKRGSDYDQISERWLAEDFPAQRRKLLAQLSNAYRKAPFFEPTIGVFESILSYEDDNLFRFILNSVKVICSTLAIDTAIDASSTLQVDHGLKGKEKVLSICESVKAGTYINPVGGKALYDKSSFAKRGLDLLFLESNLIDYLQFGGVFVPSLSIIDVLMFNGAETTRRYLEDCSLS